MKKNGMRLLSLLLAAMLVLTACGGGSGETPGGETTPPSTDPSTTEPPSAPSEPAETKAEPIKDFVTYHTAAGEMETLLALYSESTKDLDFLINCISPLLEIDQRGQYVPGVATEWGTEDNGLTWTFKLRDNVTWVDVNGNEMAKCTAHDWATSLEWVLNYHKNDSKNSSVPRQTIAGAEEYYNLVRDMDKAEAQALTADSDLFKDTVGVEIPDDYTLVYHCAKNVPYFPSLAICTAMMPLCQGQVDAVGVEKLPGMENTQLWYNGPYILQEFIQGNSKTFVRNEAYWDKDCTLFDTVTSLVVDDGLMGQQMFMNGEVDACTLSESNLRSIYDNPSSEWYPYLVEGRPTKFSYHAHFNFNKCKEDGTPDDNWNKAVANEAFRKSIYYGMDLTNYWSRINFINPKGLENLCYSMKGLVYFSDGTDYVERVWEKLGLPEGSGRYNAEKAQQYKEQAMQELAGEVTFPVVLDHYISGANQTSLDDATIIKEIVEALGTDYITLNIKTYTSSASAEVYNFRLQSWTFGNGWGALYGDPENPLFQELYGDEGAYHSVKHSNINDATDPQLIADYQEYTALTRTAADICDDMDARYEAFAEAEAYLLNKAFVIPLNYSVNWRLTRVNDYSKMYGMCGILNPQWKNWETSEEPYTTEQYAAFAAALNG